ncbi:glycosyltransferase family 2 protein [Tunturiibacter gelidoferens]|uniref:Glycosyltransferase involved in cell wall biosynthesis n=1 Tax=Tunturiibacter lichenicola TaxID=2051959 RepID=A0A7Y9NJF9_9BACT|nr:glycosyltransferase involved in cell wall biosynthesis [Edaphobacter lichenicola]
MSAKSSQVDPISLKRGPQNSPRIDVLLATYNGETFLAEQLDSLFVQTWTNFRVLVNDDGSIDDTLNILDRYATEYPGKLLWERNPKRMGPCNNFAALMRRSTADYIAFCDQDDVWRSDKLARCMERLMQVEMQCGSDTPILIYTDMKIASSDGTILSQSHWRRAGVRPEKASFRNLLAQNLVTGCTMIANRALIDLAIPVPVDDVMMHDYWSALIAAAFGVLQPLRDQTVTYRQHRHNVVGAGGGLSWIQRLRRLRSDPELEMWLTAAALQAEAFLKIFGTRLDEADRRALVSMTTLPKESWQRRNINLLRHGIRRTGKLNHLQFLLRL